MENKIKLQKNKANIKIFIKNNKNFIIFIKI